MRRKIFARLMLDIPYLNDNSRKELAHFVRKVKKTETSNKTWGELFFSPCDILNRKNEPFFAAMRQSGLLVSLSSHIALPCNLNDYVKENNKTRLRQTALAEIAKQDKQGRLLSFFSENTDCKKIPATIYRLNFHQEGFAAQAEVIQAGSDQIISVPLIELPRFNNKHIRHEFYQFLKKQKINSFLLYGMLCCKGDGDYLAESFNYLDGGPLFRVKPIYDSQAPLDNNTMPTSDNAPTQINSYYRQKLLNIFDTPRLRQALPQLLAAAAEQNEETALFELHQNLGDLITDASAAKNTTLNDGKHRQPTLPTRDWINLAPLGGNFELSGRQQRAFFRDSCLAGLQNRDGDRVPIEHRSLIEINGEQADIDSVVAVAFAEEELTGVRSSLTFLAPDRFQWHNLLYSLDYLFIGDSKMLYLIAAQNYPAGIADLTIKKMICHRLNLPWRRQEETLSVSCFKSDGTTGQLHVPLNRNSRHFLAGHFFYFEHGSHVLTMAVRQQIDSIAAAVWLEITNGKIAIEMQSYPTALPGYIFDDCAGHIMYALAAARQPFTDYFADPKVYRQFAHLEVIHK